MDFRVSPAMTLIDDGLSSSPALAKRLRRLCRSACEEAREVRGIGEGEIECDLMDRLRRKHKLRFASVRTAGARDGRRSRPSRA